VAWVLNTSTGTASTPTPVGDFVVDRQVDGMRHAPLGDLYRPKYFHGGVAVHGSPSIPGHPASHGCARVSNAAMDFLWASGAIPIGTSVRVH
jgi:lipoprotein-anchoring transpeptidase ErfK/SrfK